MNLLEKIKKKYFLSTQEEHQIEKISSEVLFFLNKHSSFLEGFFEIHGSVKKKTNLRGSDVDIFLILHLQKEELDTVFNKLLDITKDFFEKQEIKYTQHPYVVCKYKGLFFDIVPCYSQTAINSSAVDNTPLHSKYFLENSTTKICTQIKIFKIFLMTLGCYGSKYSGGFPGFFIECLLIKYKTFHKVISLFSKWNFPKKILKTNDISNYVLDFSDPTNPNRNIAASVTEEVALKIKLACNLYLSDGHNREFFFALTKPSKTKLLPFKQIKCICINFEYSVSKFELFSQKITKYYKRIKHSLKKKQINMLLSTIHYQSSKAHLCFVLDRYSFNFFSNLNFKNKVKHLSSLPFNQSFLSVVGDEINYFKIEKENDLISFVKKELDVFEFQKSGLKFQKIFFSNIYKYMIATKQTNYLKTFFC